MDYQQATKVIGLDECFLKGVVKGEFLAAIGRNANNKIYRIALAIVEYENANSWDCFLGHLVKDLRMGSCEGWVVMTNQLKVKQICCMLMYRLVILCMLLTLQYLDVQGLVSIVESMISITEHMMCARHIYASQRKRH